MYDLGLAARRDQRLLICQSLPLMMLAGCVARIFIAGAFISGLEWEPESPTHAAQPDPRRCRRIYPLHTLRHDLRRNRRASDVYVEQRLISRLRVAWDIHWAYCV